MVTTLAWVMGQLASIQRYFSDLLGDFGCIALFLSQKIGVTIKVMMNSFTQDAQIY